MKALRPFVLLPLLLATAQAWAVKPFVADYDASWKGVPATARISLQQADGGRWNYELSVQNAVGSARQATVFDEVGGSFRPLFGSDTAQLLFKKSQKDARYDWAQREARWSGDVKPDRAGPIKLQDGDLDGMLVNLAIVRDVAAGKPLSYRVVDNGTAHVQTYQNLGKDTVTVAGQARTATKVGRTSDDKQVLVWVVDGLPTPARILQRKNGQDELELTLKSVR
ncbi:DUF3108 domain-containing protein [Thermomonas haemolytica]|uniref:Uncharacterized protein DUF3108 n=1 Tax=Thermomonas haemolytica TaxID=141949 RepID=A0A4R3N9Y1_9GAMM|nr:DUF3108 domain-containing protein [Thermomonas haemolytica]TCT26208.1 uncharacterized protein DUF3108 [Thermomonas haemolytica]TNY29509.1 hypothetical protein BV505_04685 [Thermomonas haemolytica]